MLKTLCFALAAFIAGGAAAQAPSRPDPAKPDWPAPKAEYQSVFSGYQPLREQKGNVWKEVNKEVADNPGMGPMGAMKGMASMGDKGGKGAMAGMADHAAMAMAKPEGSAAPPKPTGPVSGIGVIQQIDKANGKVKMTHEPIDALGWPGMTMVFRLKSGALADQVKEGDKITFSLEKSVSGYVIASFGKPAASASGTPPMDHHMGKGEKK